LAGPLGLLRLGDCCDAEGGLRARRRAVETSGTPSAMVSRCRMLRPVSLPLNPHTRSNRCRRRRRCPMRRTRRVCRRSRRGFRSRSRSQHHASPGGAGQSARCRTRERRACTWPPRCSSSWCSLSWSPRRGPDLAIGGAVLGRDREECDRSVDTIETLSLGVWTGDMVDTRSETWWTGFGSWRIAQIDGGDRLLTEEHVIGTVAKCWPEGEMMAGKGFPDRHLRPAKLIRPLAWTLRTSRSG
jgi:hypothetical protein